MTNNTIYTKAKQILDFFNNIPYGVICNEKLYTGDQLTNNVFYQKWRLLQPLEVINFNGGICWDISSAVKTFLDDFQIENYQIYCQMDNEDKASHSFNIVYENDYTFYILDGAWKKFNTLTKTESIYQCCNIMADRMFNQHKQGNFISFYHLGQHVPFYGCNCDDYMKIAKQNQKIFTFTTRKF